MKTLLATLTLAAALSAAAAEPPRAVILEVQNMTCANYPLTVLRVLKNKLGVGDAMPEMKTATSRVSLVPATITPELLARAVTEAGYPGKARP